MKNHSIKNQNMPSYLGIYNALYSDIINGVYSLGETLPGETTLSEKYGVSRNTLRQALAILNEDGMIQKSQGKGTIVCAIPNQPTETKITNPLLSLSKIPITDTVLSYNFGCPTDIARDKLNLFPTDLVLACNSVFRSNETILGYSFTQIPSHCFETLSLNVCEKNSIKQVVEDTLFQHTKNLNTTIKLIFANEIEIEFLQIPLDTPVILIEAIHFDNQNHPLARNKFYFIPEYYHLSFNI